MEAVLNNNARSLHLGRALQLRWAEAVCTLAEILEFPGESAGAEEDANTLATRHHHCRTDDSASSNRRTAGSKLSECAL